LEFLRDDLDLKLVLDAVEESLTLIDTKGVILLQNASAGKYPALYDAPPKPGGLYLDVIHSEHRQLTRDIINNIIRNQQPHITTVRQNDSTGRAYYFEIKYVPIASADKQVVQIFIEATDISHQKLFENKITGVAAELSSLIENANAVIIGLDTAGYVTEWNAMSTSVTGYSKNDILARKIVDIMPRGSVTNLFAKAVTHVLGGNEITNFELPFQTKDEKPLTFLINGTPRKNPSGKTVGALLVGQDITELTQYRITLEEKVAERTIELQRSLENEKKLLEIRNRFVSIASHELRSPLASINYAAEWISQNISSPEEIVTKLETIKLQVTNMTHLLEDVLTIGKGDAGKLKANRVRVDLISFFESIIEEVSHTTGHTHKVVTSFPTEAETESDEKLLRNIFINLLSNSIKYSPGQKEVFLTVSQESNGISIRIKDNGIGIAPDDLQNVFEPFRRGSNTNDIKGTGLGLSIVKKAVEALDGELSMESAIGAGSTFTIKLKNDERR
jgi:PAS domain S-box-containing protein